MLVKFEQNCMVQNIQNFELFDKKPGLFKTIFDKALTPFENVSVSIINSKTTIFQCSKNYGSPTRVTRLKFAPKMADPIRLNEKRPQPLTPRKTQHTQ